MRKRGFTLIELLVVIAIIAILASILFPVFQRAREKARQTQCLSNVRQIAIAVQMYVQDNGKYPGVDTANFNNWENGVENYVGSRKPFNCPSAIATDKADPMAYGYNGLLVRPDCSGVTEAQVKFPTEVGVICDATPVTDFGSGALVGGGALSTKLEATANPDTRHNGVIIGYCDGHAKLAPGRNVPSRDTTNGVSRAFYQGIALGLVENWGGGIENPAATADPTNPRPFIAQSGTIVVGGDSAGMPVLMAAVDIFTALGGKVLSRGFNGYDGIPGGNRDRARNASVFAWLDADGTTANNGIDMSDAAEPKTIRTIAHDAMVVIVSRTSKVNIVIDKGGPNEDTINIAADDYATTTARIWSLFQEGYSATHVQAYTFPAATGGDTDSVLVSGSRRYFLSNICGKGANSTTGLWPAMTDAISVNTDAEMVNMVGNDPYGIGYCSAAYADPDKVRILDIIVDPSGTNETHHYPQTTTNKALKSVFAYPRSAADWPFIRPLYMETKKANGAFYDIIIHEDFLTGPLFEASYWDYQ